MSWPTKPVAVSLPAETWRIVLDAMDWPLPSIEILDKDRSDYSEHCFRAQQAIRRAISGVDE